MYKYLTILLASFLIFGNAFSQTTLKGNFKSLLKTDFRIVYNTSALNNFQGESLATGVTNDKGEFSSSFILTSENPVLFFIGKQFLRLWIIPNTTLSIDENAINEYVFTGKAAKHNRFLYQSGIMRPVPGNIMTKNFEATRQTEYVDSIEKKRWSLFDITLDPNEISKKFTSYCKGEITYFSFFKKNQYPSRYIYMEKTLKQEDIPSGYYNFWKQFQLLDDSCTSDFYQHSVRDYIEYNATKQLDNNITDKEKLYQIEFKILDSLLADHPFTKEKQKAEALLFIIDYLDLPLLVQSQLTNYKKEYMASPYVTLVQEKWNRKNKNAFTTPEFVLKDAAGKRFDIKSLKGKVVYIDFWGSWCKPCLAQMPNSEILQSKFKGKDVAFLFVDFYDTKERWLKTIKDKKLKGIHVKAEKENEQFFDKTFGVKQGFPRYALLDKNGMLITTSAPHPNDGDAVLLINKYLK